MPLDQPALAAVGIDADGSTSSAEKREQPLFSICIPTYNRAALLDESLSALWRQIESAGLIKQFQICISDNGSEDSTPAIVDKYRAIFTCFSAARLSANQGFGNNLKSVLALARGTWVVVLGDDDLVTERTLALLLLHADASEPLVIFNTAKGERYAQGGLAGCGTHALYGCAEILQRLGVYQLSSIANFMVKRASLKAAIGKMDMRSAYPHTQALFAVAELSQSRFVDEPLLIAEGHHRDWNILAPLLSGVDMARVLRQGPFQAKLSRALRWNCYLRLMRNLPRAVLLERNGNIAPEPGNPYRSLALGNIAEAYGSNLLSAMSAVLLAIIFRHLPLVLAVAMVRRLGQPLTLPPHGRLAKTSLDAAAPGG